MTLLVVLMDVITIQETGTERVLILVFLKVAIMRLSQSSYLYLGFVYQPKLNIDTIPLLVSKIKHNTA